MKELLLLATLAAAMAPAAPALAQPKADGRAAHDSAAATDLSEGEIRKVDKQAAKLTIKHGELKNLDMPPMTMVFQVKDKAMLDAVKPGDKVRFRVEKVADSYVVTRIQPAP